MPTRHETLNGLQPMAAGVLGDPELAGYQEGPLGRLKRYEGMPSVTGYARFGSGVGNIYKHSDPGNQGDDDPYHTTYADEDGMTGDWGHDQGTPANP